MSIIGNIVLLSPFVILYAFQIILFIKRLMRKPSHIATQIIVLLMNLALFIPLFLFMALGVAIIDSNVGGADADIYKEAFLIVIIPFVMLVSSIIDLCIRGKFKK